MGSWGYQPKQSDSALDALAPLDRALEREVYALFGFDGAAVERRDRRERRKAARARKPSRTLKGRTPHARMDWSGWTPEGDHRGTLQHARGAAEKKGLMAQSRALDDRWARVGALQVLLERDMSMPRAVIEQAIADVESILAEPNWSPSFRAARRMRGALQALLDRSNRHTSYPSDEIMPWRGWPGAERKPRCPRRGSLFARLDYVLKRSAKAKAGRRKTRKAPKRK